MRKLLISFLSLTAHQWAEQAWWNEKASKVFFKRSPQPMSLRFGKLAPDLWFMQIQMMAVRVNKKCWVLEGKIKLEACWD